MIKELEEYRDYLQYQKNYSLYTVENYCSDIVQFLDYLNYEPGIRASSGQLVIFVG